MFSSSSYSGTVNENVPTDTTVSGITLSATDSDGDSITYSIISSAGPFKLSGAGMSVLTNGLAIDFETQDSYSLTVQAEAAGDYGINDVILKWFSLICWRILLQPSTPELKLHNKQAYKTSRSFMKNSEYSCFDFAYSLLSFMERKTCIIPNAHKVSFYLFFLFLCKLFFCTSYFSLLICNLKRLPLI